jgi:hypothetical protein
LALGALRNPSKLPPLGPDSGSRLAWPPQNGRRAALLQIGRGPFPNCHNGSITETGIDYKGNPAEFHNLKLSRHYVKLRGQCPPSGSGSAFWQLHKNAKCSNILSMAHWQFAWLAPHTAGLGATGLAARGYRAVSERM